jgi:hypothetical protein
LVWPDIVRECEQVSSRVTFDVVFDIAWGAPDLGHHVADILECDVTRIRSRMHGDPRCTGSDARTNCRRHTWKTPAARIPQRRDFVDVDGKLDGHGDYPKCSLTLPAISDAQR